MTEILIELPIALIVMILLFRFMGNKELQQSTPLEFAYMVLMASIAWDMTLNQDYPIWATYLIMVLVVIMIYTIDWITYKSRFLENFFIGEPKLIIKDGEIIVETLRKERISESELRARLRLKGIFFIQEVELCYLEFNGQLSIKKKE